MKTPASRQPSPMPITPTAEETGTPMDTLSDSSVMKAMVLSKTKLPLNAWMEHGHLCHCVRVSLPLSPGGINKPASAPAQYFSNWRLQSITSRAVNLPGGLTPSWSTTSTRSCLSWTRRCFISVKTDTRSKAESRKCLSCASMETGLNPYRAVSWQVYWYADISMHQLPHLKSTWFSGNCPCHAVTSS